MIGPIEEQKTIKRIPERPPGRRITKTAQLEPKQRMLNGPMAPKKKKASMSRKREAKGKLTKSNRQDMQKMGCT